MRSPYKEEALSRTPVEEVWGIGPAYSKLLKRKRILTALNLRDVDTRWARKAMTVVGARILMELRGESCMPLEVCPPAKKAITCSRSFGVAVSTLADVREAVAFYMARATEKLRRAPCRERCHRIYSDRLLRLRAAVLQRRHSYSRISYGHATGAAILRPGCVGTNLSGGLQVPEGRVIMQGLMSADQMTLRMFDNTHEKFRQVMVAVDRINRRWGRDPVRLGAVRADGRSQTKFQKRSPRYTTCLNEVITV